MVVIGIDLDNTIVQYDQIIYEVAIQKGLIPIDTLHNKTIIRDIFRVTGQEYLWTEIQGYIYGKGMGGARPFPGFIRFLKTCNHQNIPVYIISHRSKTPYAGGDTDLHETALNWLIQEKIAGSSDAIVPRDRVFFELTKEEKYRRIADTGCTIFIDDLVEFLISSLFPKNVRAILFDPFDNYPEDTRYHRRKSWDEIITQLQIL